MARLQLNKSSLSREATSLRTYERFLPSLDLKRQQLMAERAKAARVVAQTRASIKELSGTVATNLPMLGNNDVDLSRLVVVSDVKVGAENVVGTRMPVLEHIELEERPYGFLTKPHWVDNTVTLLRDLLELRVRVQVEESRIEQLDAAVKTITQRVNLFEQVLIPRTQLRIKRIRVYLSDEAMAAVVRSKLAKRKHLAAGGS